MSSQGSSLASLISGKILASGKFQRLCLPPEGCILKCMQNAKPQGNRSDEPVTREEFTELILEPLSSLIDDARLKILKKVQDVEKLVTIVARQVRREIDERSP